MDTDFFRRLGIGYPGVCLLSVLPTLRSKDFVAIEFRRSKLAANTLMKALYDCERVRFAAVSGLSSAFSKA